MAKPTPEERRRVWVQFACSAMVSEQIVTTAQHFEAVVPGMEKEGASREDFCPNFHCMAAAEVADEMLKEFDARFPSEE